MRILNEQQTIPKTYTLLIAFLFALLTVTTLSIGIFSSHAEMVQPTFDWCEPLQKEGQFFVLPVYKNVQNVKAISRENPSKETSRFLSRDQWTFDPKTGLLDLRTPIDRTEYILVFGESIKPWIWRTREKFLEDSVRLLIEDRVCEKGKDFDVDAEKREIRILDPSLCDDSHFVLLTYDIAGDVPRSKGFSRGKNDENGQKIPRPELQKILNRFIGLPENYTPKRESDGKLVDRIILTQSQDPHLFQSEHPFDSNGLFVGVMRTRNCWDTQWLTEDEYTADGEKGTIRLADPISVKEDQGEILRVLGVIDGNITLSH